MRAPEHEGERVVQRAWREEARRQVCRRFAHIRDPIRGALRNCRVDQGLVCVAVPDARGAVADRRIRLPRDVYVALVVPKGDVDLTGRSHCTKRRREPASCNAQACHAPRLSTPITHFSGAPKRRARVCKSERLPHRHSRGRQPNHQTKATTPRFLYLSAPPPRRPHTGPTQRWISC